MSIAGLIVILVSGLTWLWAYQQVVQAWNPDNWQRAYLNGNTFAALAFVTATQYHAIPISLLTLSILAAMLINILLERQEANDEQQPG